MDRESQDFTFPTALLKDESPEEFATLYANINQDVEPQNFFQRMYIDDVANLTWEIMRNLRAKAAILNSAMRGSPILWKRTPSLEELWSKDDPEEPSEEERNVAIEGMAFRDSLGHIEKLDRLIASAESRRDKALRNIAKSGERFAERLEWSSGRLLAADSSPAIAPPN
jgi:hypothetical protein